MVELGRIYIAIEVSQISYFLAMTRQGHLVNALHMMSYSKIKHNSMLVLDPSYPRIDMSKFKSNENWAPFYGDVQEATPMNYTKPLGKEVTLRMFLTLTMQGERVTVVPGRDS